jgi:hypothetical protein
MAHLFGLPGRIFIFSSNFEQHLVDVAEVLKIMKEANVQLKPCKCQFFKTEISFLGHEISPGCLKMPHEKSRAIAAVRPLKSQHGIRSFLGLVGVSALHSQFLPNCRTAD